MIRNPRVAFDLLFGAGRNATDRTARRRENQSILDWITGEVAGLKRELGAADKARVDKYLADIRELERRIQAVEARKSSGAERELPEAPVGVPDSFAEHMKLMFDFQVLAFQSDMTRVFSFKTGLYASSLSRAERTRDYPRRTTARPRGRILDFNETATVACFRTSGQLEHDGRRQRPARKTVIMYGS
jgi:hypothetical protein